MNRLLKQNKKILLDFLYSSIAYALPTFVLQIIVLPIVARVLSDESNGLFLTLLSVVRLLISLLISSLANLRLIDKRSCKEYLDNEKKFNALFSIAGATAVSISVYALCRYMPERTLFDILLVIVFTTFYCLHDYYSIQFRVRIEYGKIVIDNMLNVAGMALGLLLFLRLGEWEYIFILGYAFSTTYVLFNTNVWRKGLQYTGILNLASRYFKLGSSVGFDSSITYCDRIVMYPILGGTSVSVYNASSVVSKIVTLVSVPVKNVLLSYIVDKDAIKAKRSFVYGVIAIGISFVSYFIILFVSNQLCRILYPMYYDKAMIYIPITTVTIILESLANILNIILLQFKDAGVQTQISFLRFLSYLFSMVLLVIVLKLELYGFCLAALMSSIIRFAIVLFYVNTSIDWVEDR